MPWWHRQSLSVALNPISRPHRLTWASPKASWTLNEFSQRWPSSLGKGHGSSDEHSVASRVSVLGVSLLVLSESFVEVLQAGVLHACQSVSNASHQASRQRTSDQYR